METAVFSNHGTTTNRISQIVFDSSLDQIGGSILNSDNTLYEWRYWPVTRPGSGAERIQNIVYSSSDYAAILVGGSWHYLPTRNILASHLTTQSYNYDYSIAAGGIYNRLFWPNKDGYSPLGIIRYATNNVDVVPVNINFSTEQYGIVIKNTASSTKTGSLYLLVLFVKTY